MRFIAVSLAFLAAPALAQDDAFHPGPAIAEFGPVASVKSDQALPAKSKFKIRFDVEDAAKPGELNRNLVSAARFINMSAENGVALKNIDLAIVVHGGATKDLTTDAHYSADGGAANANAPLIAGLLAKGVEVYLCGQSAAAHGVKKQDLLPGVKMSLSAMHAHALLDAQGYSLNPF
jgi:intracellular sulfur oxidation DsrE/DsrF family protein